MYKTYRLATTKNIANFVKTGESFRLTGKSGVGKSKYLRFLAGSKSIYSNYFKHVNVKFYYLDLNRLSQKTPNELLQEICKVFDVKQNIEQLDNFLIALKDKKQKVYLIVDHFENLQHFEKDSVRFLRSLRDSHKKSLCYVFSYDTSAEIDKNRLYRLFEIAAVEIELTNLDKQETIENIKYTAKKFDLEISDEELEKMTEVSAGYPRFIKQLLSHKLAGVDIDKAIINIQNLNMGIDKNDDYFLDTAIKNMTKAEYMFFEEMYYKKDKVIVRDRFANLLSPESEGQGVSNEAIDQVVSRLRKKLEQLKFPFHIKTQRGIGYYME